MKIDVMKLTLKKEYEIQIPNHDGYVYGVDSAKPIFCRTIGNNNVEYVAMICLDSTNKIINYSTLAMGSINNVSLQFAQLFRIVLLSNASKVIIAHNHPSGILKFTSNDIQITKKIGSLLKVFNVELIDSIIVYGENAKSIREYVGDSNG